MQRRREEYESRVMRQKEARAYAKKTVWRKTELESEKHHLKSSRAIHNEAKR